MPWPKAMPVLSAELAQRKHDWELYWLKLHPNDKKYSFVDRFTRRFVGTDPGTPDDKVLEIGPGPNPAIRYLKTAPENYYAIDRSPEFCAALANRIPSGNIWNGDVADELALPTGAFDRIIAAHVFEHLLDLPPVLTALTRALKPQGRLDVVLPCEAGLAYTIGRKFSSEREYKRKFGEGFAEIMRSEHVNTIFELWDELTARFEVRDSLCFPFPLPASKPAFQINLLVGMRLAP